MPPEPVAYRGAKPFVPSLCGRGAATSLATLWNGESKSRDGHELLAGIVGWFTEGSDTADYPED